MAALESGNGFRIGSGVEGCRALFGCYDMISYKASQWLSLRI